MKTRRRNKMRRRCCFVEVSHFSVPGSSIALRIIANCSLIIVNYLSPLFQSFNESAKIEVKDGMLRVKDAMRSLSYFLTEFSIIELRSD